MRVRCGAILCLSLAACATSPETPRTQAPQRQAWERSCTEYARAPVSVRFEDVPGGAAVVYRSQGNLAALRQRTREIADFHNSPTSNVGAPHDLFEVPHRAYVEEVKDGARLVLMPNSTRPQLLDALRLEVQEETLMLRRHGCGTGPEAL